MNNCEAPQPTASTSGCFFKQTEEKNISQEVTQMLWNPKMDLIALAFANGDCHLYRMSFQKVWSASSPHQNVTITSMAWRPDGKVLAVSYEDGHLRVLGVEDGNKIFYFNCNEPIQWLYWLQEDDEMSQRHETHSFYDSSLSNRQLPKPISYDMIHQMFEKSTNKDFPDNLLIKETKNLTYLICAHGTSIAIFVYGYFLLVDANLDLVPSFLHYKQLKACFLSDNTSLVSTFGLTEENLLVYSLLDAKILHENHIQIKMIASKFGLLFSMLTSLKSVIKEMEEAWEDILVEMDQKFQVYALEKYNNVNNTVGMNSNQTTGSDSSLVQDFMTLYAFGTCSDHFKTFLLHELTEKGLKKLELSVENYYSNIQRLLSGNFHQIALCMYHHLNELYGMTKWFDKFKIFSLTENKINDVLNNCASLLLKAQELNSVIQQNMKEIKLFFKWLHSSIAHLSENETAVDNIRFNEEMENMILNFIQNTFKDAQTINLEKVGQYLKQEDLRILIPEDNQWQAFINQKMISKECQNLHLSKREKSLIGCFEDFKQTLNNCFRTQAINSKEPFTFIKQYNIHKFNSNKDANEMLLSYKCIKNSMITGLLMAKSNNECYILKHSVDNDPDVKAFIINFSSHGIDNSQISLQDIYIYNDNNVTLMGTDNATFSNTYLIQLNLQMSSAGVLNALIEVATGNGYPDKRKEQSEQGKKARQDENLLMIKAEKMNADAIIKCIRNLKSSSFCVSSSRKVASLLSANRHKVRIFELECEDEDDEPMEGSEQANDESGCEESVGAAPVRSKMTMRQQQSSSQPSVVEQQRQTSYCDDDTSILSTKVPFLPMPSDKSRYPANEFPQPPQHGTTSLHFQHPCSSASSLVDQSICSIAATVGSSVTIESASITASRAKRKKEDFDDELEDEAADDDGSVQFNEDTDFASADNNSEIHQQ